MALDVDRQVSNLGRQALVMFLHESNRIEGIARAPSLDEIEAAERLFGLPELSVGALGEYQAVCAPGQPLRERVGMDVRVGRYIAPPGGPNIKARLQKIIEVANLAGDPWWGHCRFEMLHPYWDGNGRTGRMLWLWLMRARDPFGLPFLHRFYYQTLEAQT